MQISEKQDRRPHREIRRFSEIHGEMVEANKDLHSSRDEQRAE